MTTPIKKALTVTEDSTTPKPTKVLPHVEITAKLDQVYADNKVTSSNYNAKFRVSYEVIKTRKVVKFQFSAVYVSSSFGNTAQEVNFFRSEIPFAESEKELKRLLKEAQSLNDQIGKL